jgi:hypothetical protein
VIGGGVVGLWNFELTTPAAISVPAATATASIFFTARTSSYV